MPSLKIQLPQPTAARRQRTALGQYHREPWLTRWPSGAPLSTLGEYKRAPWLQHYNNGVPMTAPPDGSSVPKAHLVQMALRIALSKKCGCSAGLRGLGDDGSGDDSGDYISASDTGGASDIYAQPVPPETSPPPVIIAGGAPEDTGISVPSQIPTESVPIEVPGATTSGGYTYNPATGALTPTGTPTNSNTFSNFVNGLLGALTSPSSARPGYVLNPATGQYVYTGASGLSSLSSPLYPGSSLSLGNVLLIGGIALVGMMVIGGGGKRRR